MTFNGAGQTQTITPNTRNGIDTSYTFILQNGELANISPVGLTTSAGSGGMLERELGFSGRRATTPIFLNEGERKRSITVTAKAVNLISRSITAQTSTNITVVGNNSGAQFTLPVTVKADPSKV